MLPSVAPQELGSVNATVKVGNGLTVMVPSPGVLEQPVDVDVKTMSAVPSETPVTTPPFVIVATLTSLLAHVPPVAGVTFKVAPSQRIPLDGMVTVVEDLRLLFVLL